MIGYLCNGWTQTLLPSYLAQSALQHGWGLPVLYYHKIMAIYPYSFLVVITLLSSCIIFINGYICILTGLPGLKQFIIVYVIQKIEGNDNSPNSLNVMVNYQYHKKTGKLLGNPHICLAVLKVCNDVAVAFLWCTFFSRDTSDTRFIFTHTILWWIISCLDLLVLLQYDPNDVTIFVFSPPLSSEAKILLTISRILTLLFVTTLMDSLYYFSSYCIAIDLSLYPFSESPRI